MKRRKKLLWQLIVGVVLATLGTLETCVLVIGRAEVTELSREELELIRAVIELRHQEGTDAGLYFLTPTPFQEWENGGWKRFSDEFHDSIAGLPKPYKPADGAYIYQGTVKSRLSHRNATMRWVSVVEWRSSDEAVVSDGVWRRNLGGGGTRSVWKRRNGRWEWSESLGGWVS